MLIDDQLRAMGMDANAELREAFKALDSDHSGNIEYREFSSYYRQLYRLHVQKGLDLEAMKNLFAYFDGDQDGSVTVSEFVILLGVRVLMPLCTDLRKLSHNCA